MIESYLPGSLHYCYILGAPSLIWGPHCSPCTDAGLEVKSLGAEGFSKMATSALDLVFLNGFGLEYCKGLYIIRHIMVAYS